MQRAFRPNIAARHNAFTLIELLVVIAIIACARQSDRRPGWPGRRKSKEAQVRAQLNGLITAIDRYKKRVWLLSTGQRSEQHGGGNECESRHQSTLLRTDRSYCEQSVGNFSKPEQTYHITALTVQSVFHRDGFVNASTDPKELKFQGANLKANQVENGCQSVAPRWTSWFCRRHFPRGIPRQYLRGSPFESLVNPWRYVSTNPTNNPASFDLWAEVPLNNKEVRTIGNWKE
jgi:prepilin-type N-terminal cleavage/methylation domain-containing protein